MIRIRWQGLDGTSLLEAQFVRLASAKCVLSKHKALRTHAADPSTQTRVFTTLIQGKHIYKHTGRRCITCPADRVFEERPQRFIRPRCVPDCPNRSMDPTRSHPPFRALTKKSGQRVAERTGVLLTPPNPVGNDSHPADVCKTHYAT